MQTQLTDVLKRIILNKGLYKTGLLYNTIEVEINIQTQTISIFAQYYFKFLIEEYRIIDQFTQSQEFVDACTEIMASNFDFNTQEIVNENIQIKIIDL